MDRLGIAKIKGNASRLVNISWNSDKYPDAEVFTPRAKLTILDAKGPGVITNIHSTAYFERSAISAESEKRGAALWIKVYYDGDDKCAIDMPFMDFLGDPDCSAEPYATEYFSKVKISHNMYLPMPYKERIRIEVENRSDDRLMGYMTLQYEPLDAWTEDMGYLRTEWREGRATIPDDIIEACALEGNGALVAHWLQLGASNALCAKGEYLCEANDEFYIDGEAEPSLEYLGTEDLYGFSWGFRGVQSDGRAAIIREEPFGNGEKIAMLRCRNADRLRFRSSLRLLLNYRNEYFSAFSANPSHANALKARFPVDYKSCCYYYAIKDERA